MSKIAYFIGGPLDLTKTAIQEPTLRPYALEKAALNLSEIHRAQDARYAMDLIKSRHVYLYRGECRIAQVNHPVFIYMYEGREDDKP